MGDVLGMGLVAGKIGINGGYVIPATADKGEIGTPDIVTDAVGAGRLDHDLPISGSGLGRRIGEPLEIEGPVIGAVRGHRVVQRVIHDAFQARRVYVTGITMQHGAGAVAIGRDEGDADGPAVPDAQLPPGVPVAGQCADHAGIVVVPGIGMRFRLTAGQIAFGMVGAGHRRWRTGVGIPMAVVAGRFHRDMPRTVVAVERLKEHCGVAGVVGGIVLRPIRNIMERIRRPVGHVHRARLAELSGQFVDEQGAVVAGGIEPLDEDDVGVGGHAGVLAGGVAVAGGAAGDVGAVAVGVGRGAQAGVDLGLGPDRADGQAAQITAEDIGRSLAGGGHFAVPQVEDAAAAGGRIDEVLVGPVDAGVDDADDGAFAGVALGEEIAFLFADDRGAGPVGALVVVFADPQDRADAFHVGQGGQMAQFTGRELGGHQIFLFSILAFQSELADDLEFFGKQPVRVAVALNLAAQNVEIGVTPIFLYFLEENGSLVDGNDLALAVLAVDDAAPGYSRRRGLVQHTLSSFRVFFPLGLKFQKGRRRILRLRFVVIAQLPQRTDQLIFRFIGRLGR